MEQTRRKFIAKATAIGAAALLGKNCIPSNVFADSKENSMTPLKFFLDTHDRNNKTFPDKISPKEFEQFYAQYKEACYAEGVIPIRLHVGYNDGKAFCLTMAADEQAVKKAHERVGLPYDSITEVQMATPGDTFFGIQ